MLNTAKDFFSSIESEFRDKGSEEIFRIARERIRFQSHAVGTLVRRLIQTQGARAVDGAVRYLGLGQYGVRMSSLGFQSPRELWEAELRVVSASSIAEAAERISMQALSEAFDLTSGSHSAGSVLGRPVLGAERAEIGELSIRWLGQKTVDPSGRFRLSWTRADREAFRRLVLSNLSSGASQRVAAQVFAQDGLLIAEVEIEWKAWARPPLPAKEG